MATDVFSPSAEFALTAACCIWPPSKRRDEAIRAAASSGVDWDRMLRIVARHRVAGLVHEGLTRAQTAMPPAFAETLAEHARKILRSNLDAAADALERSRSLGLESERLSADDAARLRSLERRLQAVARGS